MAVHMFRNEVKDLERHHETTSPPFSSQEKEDITGVEECRSAICSWQETEY